MLKIYIGPNGYGKTTKLNDLKRNIDKESSNNSFMLNSKLVLENEMKDTVNDSMMMDYIINDILNDKETIKAKTELEEAIDKSINKNIDIINDILSYSLSFNEKTISKDVLELRPDKEYKKLVKINSDDLKKSMGSGQKLIFLLSLIKLSKRENIFLDEPENHCHPSLLHVIAEIINELSLSKNVYIATHSPKLLSLLDIDFEEIYLLNDATYITEKKIDFVSAIDIHESFNIENLNNKSKSYYNVEKLKKNIKDIHNNNFFEVLFSKKVYIVEGINDELFLKRLLLENNKQYDDYSIFCSYGKPHMIPFINIFKQLGLVVKVLYDSDEQQHPKDENLKKVNLWIKNNSESYCFNDNLEKELDFSKKDNTPEFLDYLDDFNFENYKDIIN